MNANIELPIEFPCDEIIEMDSEIPARVMFEFVESSPDGVVLVDEKSEIRYLNRQILTIFGYERHELIGKNIQILITHSVHARHGHHVKKYLNQPKTRLMNSGQSLHGVRKDGQNVLVSISLNHYHAHGENMVICAVRDITEILKTANKLEKIENKFETFFNENPLMCYSLNKDKIILSVNKNGADQLGYTVEELIGQHVSKFAHPEDEKIWSIELESCFNEPGKTHQSVFRKKHKDGSFLWVKFKARVISEYDDSLSVLVVCEDITEEHKLNKEISHMISHDALTGLVNRYEFERRVERQIATTRQNEAVHALCFMDLDQFKVINDTCGHMAGDEFLRQLTVRMQSTMRKRDTLARLGGDEFGVLMDHCSLSDAYRVVISLLKVVQDFSFVWDRQLFRVGASMGLVAINETVSNMTELMKHADAACYVAKESGRNRIQVYSPEDSELSQRQVQTQWVTRLHQALKEDRFCLYAQAIVSVNEGHGYHYELLIRLKGEKGELIQPGEFLPAAERYDMTTKLDRWVIDHAFTLLMDNPVFLEKIEFISINLSGQSLTSDNFQEFVVEQLQHSGIVGNKICFEITETSVISNLTVALSFISSLKKMGCRFALDDFGRGFSSFAYLKNLPVDYLKIDGMFVKDIVDDPIDRAMVKSINEIGQVMGMQTIAEFVENDEIKGMLREIGVNYAQGYGIGRPIPFLELLENSSNMIDIKKRVNDGSEK